MNANLSGRFFSPKGVGALELAGGPWVDPNGWYSAANAALVALGVDPSVGHFAGDAIGILASLPPGEVRSVFGLQNSRGGGVDPGWSTYLAHKTPGGWWVRMPHIGAAIFIDDALAPESIYAELIPSGLPTIYNPSPGGSTYTAPFWTQFVKTAEDGFGWSEGSSGGTGWEPGRATTTVVVTPEDVSWGDLVAAEAVFAIGQFSIGIYWEEGADISLWVYRTDTEAPVSFTSVTITGDLGPVTVTPYEPGADGGNAPLPEGQGMYPDIPYTLEVEFEV